VPADETPTMSRAALVTLWFGRALGNWSLRFTYSFLPTIARGVGIPLETAGLVAGARELAGVAGPWLARLVDRGARRTALALSLLVLAVASITAVIGGAAGFAIGMVVAGLAKVAYDVAANAWIGDHVPFERRGRVTGLFETSWAAAFLIGVPLTAVLIDTWSWRAPFLAVAVLAAFVALLVPGVIAPDRPVPVPKGSRHHLRPAALAFYAAVFLQSLGPQLVFASYGAWFEEDFGLGVAAVGSATVVFGVAELAASSGSSVLTDRLGKRRSMALGLGVLVPLLLALGLVGDSKTAAVAVLALTFLAFEFSLVSGIPLASEIDPDARSRSVGTTYAAMTGARAIGAAGGIALFAAHGIGWTGAVGAVVTLGAIVVLVLFVEEP
jgi:predicted MFS family arabinose efflux permease